MGFEGKDPKLYVTEPSGAYSLWRAQAIGRGSKQLREYLEKNYEDGMDAKKAIRLAVETLMEVVESSKNIEICVAYPNRKFENIEDETIDRFVKEIEKEREEADQKKQ